MTLLDFWDDCFLDTPFSVRFPALYIYVRNDKQSLREALVTDDRLELFRLPMSRLAYDEFLCFQDLIISLRSNANIAYYWTFIWVKSFYSSAAIYKHHFQAITPPEPSFGFGNQNASLESSSSLGFFCRIDSIPGMSYAEETST